MGKVEIKEFMKPELGKYQQQAGRKLLSPGSQGVRAFFFPASCYIYDSFFVFFSAKSLIRLTM
jgi:hypothetical protein